MDRQKVLIKLAQISECRQKLDYMEVKKIAENLLEEGKSNLTEEETKNLLQLIEMIDLGTDRLLKKLNRK